MQTTGPATREVTLVGADFQPGAQVLVSVDYGPYTPLATTIVSPTELRAVLPREQWRERFVEVTGQITDAGGTQETVKFVRRLRPWTSVTAATGSLANVAPTTFFDAGFGYLVDTRTGQHKGNTFNQNSNGFTRISRRSGPARSTDQTNEQRRCDAGLNWLSNFNQCRELREHRN